MAFYSEPTSDDFPNFSASIDTAEWACYNPFQTTMVGAECLAPRCLLPGSRRNAVLRAVRLSQAHGSGDFFYSKGDFMAWVFLVLAGLLECFWSAMMKLSEGFSRSPYAALMIVGMIASFALLILATKRLPLSLAYPVWTGIGAVGAVMVGAFVFKDSVRPVTWAFVALLIIGIIGIKATSGE